MKRVRQTTTTPKAGNGCSRCPAGKVTPCTEPRHSCTECNGINIVAVPRVGFVECPQRHGAQ